MVDLLEAGVHFGHLTRKWNPKMKKYIFTSRDDVHVIDLALTVEKLKEAIAAIEDILSEGGTMLLVGTKRQAAVVIADIAKKHGFPYINQRWLGGLLTNFENVGRTWKRLEELDEQIADDKTFKKLSTRDQFVLKKEQEKLDRLVGGLRGLTETPRVIFVVDVKRESTAVDEARKMGVPVVAIVDTNTDPSAVDFAIPGNDDGLKSIEVITQAVVDAALAGKKKNK